MLFNKVLYHWHIAVNYQTLSLCEIRASIECADALNSFDEDVIDQKIDDLIDEAIRLNLPELDDIIRSVCENV